MMMAAYVPFLIAVVPVAGYDPTGAALPPLPLFAMRLIGPRRGRVGEDAGRGARLRAITYAKGPRDQRADEQRCARRVVGRARPRVLPAALGQFTHGRAKGRKLLWTNSGDQRASAFS